MTGGTVGGAPQLVHLGYVTRVTTTVTRVTARGTRGIARVL